MILSICIPTYNRQNKILRTVTDFYDQILLSGEKDEIELVVSNNCSTDDTKKVLDELYLSKINFRVFNQTENLGFDGNTKFLYKEAKGQYVWYFGDDDIIFEGTVKTIFDTIKGGEHGGMRFSFMQPIGDTDLSFPYPPGECHLIKDKAQIIQCCFMLSKVSTYVLKRVEPLEELFSTITKYEDQGYWFIALAVRVFEKLGEDSDGLIVCTKQLASCDDEVFDNIDVPPAVWNNRAIIAAHPFVKRHHPKFYSRLVKDDYRSVIWFMWKYKTGEFKVAKPKEYDQFLKKINIRLLLLLGARPVLYRMLVLKLGLFPLYAKISRSRIKK